MSREKRERAAKAIKSANSLEERVSAIEEYLNLDVEVDR